MQKFKIYRDSIDIDYYVYFTKAYFAFNAYLKAKHPTLTDLDKIREMKNDITVSRKFKSLVEDGKHFRDDLIALKENLNSTVIKNNNEIITFDRVKIGDHNVVEIFNESYNGVAYFIKAIDNDLFTFKVKDTQPNPFKIEQLEETLNSISITTTQKSKVRALITEHVENYNINLSNEIEILRNFNDLTNTEKAKLCENLYKGFIEILYKLRNGLFHSEVEPNSDVMKVYKFTYFILRKILHEIPTP
ncbi:MAG: hypothetical protein ACNI3H_01570 [Halarcobacter ebronensis]|uniref:hypothetical protein n=1 Tax=Halarcobacter ebronensis TaxID=1462615 RepID=UPI003C7743E0